MATVKVLYKGKKDQLNPPEYFTNEMVKEYNRIKELFDGTMFLDNYEHALLENAAYSWGKYCQFVRDLENINIDDDPKRYDNYFTYMNKYYNNYLNGLKELGVTSLTRLKYLTKDLEELDKPVNKFSKFAVPGDHRDHEKVGTVNK